MRVLLDENLPHDLIVELADYDVVTVQGLGWLGHGKDCQLRNLL